MAFRHRHGARGAPAAAAAQRLFLTSGATSPQLPAQVPDYLYLACFGDNVQAAAAAEWALRNWRHAAWQFSMMQQCCTPKG
ncbi:MAG: hypothetical protein R2932_29740 [Caldilineaceae bacterium]